MPCSTRTPGRLVSPDPHVHASDRADLAGLDDLDHAAIVVAGVDLRAHLRDGLLLGRAGCASGGLRTPNAPAAFRNRRRARAAGPRPTGMACVWSGVETTTASRFFSLSSSWRKSTYVLALGKRSAMGPRCSESTSHRATIFSLVRLSMLCGPFVGHADAGQVQLFVRARAGQGRLRTDREELVLRPSAWPCRPAGPVAGIRGAGGSGSWHVILGKVVGMLDGGWRTKHRGLREGTVPCGPAFGYNSEPAAAERQSLGLGFRYWELPFPQGFSPRRT